MARKKKNKKIKMPVPPPFVWGLAIIAVLIFGLYLAGPYIRKWQARHSPIYPVAKIRGIDVSHFQEEIDWDKVARSRINGEPVSFVFIKATEGKTILDEYFVYNFASARKHGIIRGAYHVFSSKSTPQEQAEFFCNVVQLKEKDLYPVLDVEQLGRYTPRQLREGILDWMNIVEKHYGVTPILYTSYSLKRDYLSGPEFNRYPYWIAHYYVDELAYSGQWKFWQHTDVGTIGGIKSKVDMNVFNGTYAELLCLTMTKPKFEGRWDSYGSDSPNKGR